jgi:cytochrome b involved in lipid metabolism
MKKYIFSVMVLTLVVLGGYFALNNQNSQKASEVTTGNSSPQQNTTESIPRNGEVASTSAPIPQNTAPEKVRMAAMDQSNMATAKKPEQVVLAAKQAAVPSVKMYTLADVQANNTEQSCYTAINGSVYNLTEWINKHPGGKMAIMFICGKDGTRGFMGKHAQNESAKAALSKYKIGELSQ